MFQSVHVSFGKHPAYLLGTGGFHLWIKLRGREVDPTPPCCNEIKDEWSYTSIPPICPHGAHVEFVVLMKRNARREFCTAILTKCGILRHVDQPLVTDVSE